MAGDQPNNGDANAGNNGGQQPPTPPATPPSGDGSGGKPGEGDGDKTAPLAALHEARNENKELKKRIADIEAKEKQREEEEAKKKGEYQTLFESTKTENEALKKTNEGLVAQVGEFEKSIQTQIDEALSKVKKPEDQEVIKLALDGKSVAQKQALLPKLLEKFLSPSNINPTIPGGGKGNDDPEAKRKEAKEKKDVMGLIANAPVLGKKEV